MGSIPGCCWVQSYQRRLKMGVVSSCMVLTMKEGPRNVTGRPGVCEGQRVSDELSFMSLLVSALLLFDDDSGVPFFTC